MKNKLFKSIWLTVGANLVMAGSPFVFAADSTTAKNPIFHVEKILQAVIAGKSRSSKNALRDKYRHPAQTLSFFGLKNNMTVVELWPGRGWYTEILAPYLKDKGHYIAAGFEIKKNPLGVKKAPSKYRQKLASQPEFYANVKITELGAHKQEMGKDGTADMVLSFRNLHNWMGSGYEDKVFDAAFKALKVGGVFGITEHKARPNQPVDNRAKSGYVDLDLVIKMAEKAGFKLAAQSDINKNKLDTKNHPKGVWSLPPTLAGKMKDRAKYLAIGESDRMTLKFIKPLKLN